MQRYWNTADEPTNSNVRFLESLGTDWPSMTVEQAIDKFAMTIAVEKMLPAVVARHFKFPSLYIGSETRTWTPQRQQERVKQLCAAINGGLDRVYADQSLLPGGGADFSDRPKTKGEAIDEALERFQKAWRTGHWASELSALETATYGTPMQSKVARIRELLGRKRWSGPNTVEYEIYREMGSIESVAARYHHEAATP